MTGSNRRPPPCKGDALPTELIAQSQFLSTLRVYLSRWWVMTGSNRRPPPCKGDALPTELITPAVWSRIIGIAQNESTIFRRKNCVRLKIKQDVAISGKSVTAPSAFAAKAARKQGIAVEDSSCDDRMLPTLFWIYQSSPLLIA